jgi:16S rRNA processing protein RimM
VADQPALTAVALLHRERGIKGEITGESLTSHFERFADLERVFLTKPGCETREVEVERVWDFRGSPVFKFRGIDSMTDAGKLRGYEVAIPRIERVPLEEGEYFLDDLVGCRLSDPAGLSIGTVTGWIENGPQILLEVLEVEVEAEGEPPAKEPMLVPFVKAFFTAVDVEAKTAVADLPPGLRELNRS